MNKVAVSALIGVVVAGAALAAPYVGVQVPLAVIMGAAAAISLGAASAVLTHSLLSKPAAKSGMEAFLSKRLRDTGLVMAFPGKETTLALSIRPDTKPEYLDVFENPGKYMNKDIVVTLKGEKEDRFNPIILKQLFVALAKEPNFLHVLLVRGKNEEFVGYIPAPFARTDFVGGNAEVQIARYITDVFADFDKSANLRKIGGASMVDVIRDTADVSEAMKRLAGGLERLVVLKDGYHRKPMGVLHFNDLMGKTFSNLGGKAGEVFSASAPAPSIGSLRP